MVINGLDQTALTTLLLSKYHGFLALMAYLFGVIRSGIGIQEVLSVVNFVIYVMAIAMVLFKETREEFFPTKFRFLNNRYICVGLSML